MQINIKETLHLIFKNKYKTDAGFGKKFSAMLPLIIASFVISFCIIIASMLIYKIIADISSVPIFEISVVLLLFFLITWLFLFYHKLMKITKSWLLKKIFIFQVCFMTVYYLLNQDFLIIHLGEELIIDFSYFYKVVQTGEFEYSEILFIRGKENFMYHLINFLNHNLKISLVIFFFTFYLLVENTKTYKNLLHEILILIRY